MWSKKFAWMTGIVFGIMCSLKLACPQPQLIRRQSERTPDEASSLEEDIQAVISHIRLLSGHNGDARSGASAAEGFNVNVYYRTLSDLYAVLQPLLGGGFLDDLPAATVCLLAGKQDCGLEAELAKTVSLDLVQPLLAFVSSLRSQGCTAPSSGGFLKAYLRTEAWTTGSPGGFQHSFTDILSSLPSSGKLMDAMSGLVDTAAKYALEFVTTLLQVPMDYIKIALQFGIRIPSVDEKETCEQGDLKQLIMWGLKHNVSWSLSSSLVDILLDVFLPPDQSACTYPGPECQGPTSVPLQQKSAAQVVMEEEENLLRCDRHSLAGVNDTLCADILSGAAARPSASVLAVCRSLSSLSPRQVLQVWSNTCSVAKALLSPLLTRAPVCVDGRVPPPSISSSSSSYSSSSSSRVAREAPNLQQLACNYNSWLEGDTADAVLVSLCGDNEREEFVARVCRDDALLRKLLADPMNSWLYGYCANASAADGANLLGQFCAYEQWLLADPSSTPVRPALLEFCLSLDAPRLTQLMCEHTGFFMLVFSNPENGHLMPNCSHLIRPPPPPLPFPSEESPLVPDECRYSEWNDVAQVGIELLSRCILLDQSGFAQEVCANRTFLDRLLVIAENSWLEDHCSSSVSLLPAEATQPFDITGWCDYHTWATRLVDESVVGLCWQHDRPDFQRKVCCEALVLEKLLRDPQNQWLMTACAGVDEIKEIALMPQVCKYSEWSRPIIVDMTELALCAEIDSLNFTTKVCANSSVLQNLMANPDNTWLTQHCANHSHTAVTGGGAGGGGGGGQGHFKPEEQCHYSRWLVSLPSAALLTLCWEHDQAGLVSAVCPNAALLFSLSREPSAGWVSSMCATYTNYTSGTNNTTGTNTTTTEPHFCLARNLVRQFNWTCSADFNSACRPGASQNLALQLMVRCWLESLVTRVEALLTPPVAAVLEQGVSSTVVILLALEEVHNGSLHVTENIRHSVLKAVVAYLKRQNAFEKKRVLLQCFGGVLTSLMQTTRDGNGVEAAIIEEYFKVPLRVLRPLLTASPVTTVRLILRYYNNNKQTLQLPDEYLPTVVSVLFQTHLLNDGSLFPDLAPVLAQATPSDIHTLPSLQDDQIVRDTINNHLWSLTLEQRLAFGLWYSEALSPSDITGGHRSLITDTGNLIAYLPFHIFQHLSPAQLLDGLDLLQRNTLSSLKQEFIAHSIIGTYTNLTDSDFARLGDVSCRADPEDLLAYKDSEAFGVIQNIVMNCTRHRLSLPSHLLSSLLLNTTELHGPSSLGAARLAELSPLLPLLGLPFLEGLNATELLAALPALSSVSFSPAQAATIVDKMSSSSTLTAPGQLQLLGPLIVGMKTETFLTLTSDRLLSSLPAMAQHTPGLSPPQANAIATKLWGFVEVVGWLDEVRPLLYSTPLLSVLSRTHLLVNNIPAIATEPWNTQQAKAIFNQMFGTKKKSVNADFLSLGTVGQGASCRVLQEYFRADPSPSSLRRILALLRQQPAPLHTSLKKCVIEELYQFEFFSELLEDLGAEIALSMPVSTIKKFPIDMMDTLRTMIIQEPHHFLMLSRTKQELLVDKMVQRLGMYTGLFTEAEFRSLGIMAPFVVDEVFIQLDRSFFLNNLDFLRGLCYSSSKMDLVARILEEATTFGSVTRWNRTTLSHVDHFLFFLPESKLQEISPALMTVGRIEKLFMSQRQWEQGEVGARCSDPVERRKLFEKQQFVLQFFLGFLKINPTSLPPMVPTCQILHTTAPSAWTSSSLTSMSSSAFSNCLELMGQDPFLTSYQRSQVLGRVRQIYGPVSSFSQSLISQLGGVAVELSVEELGSLHLTDRRSIAAMGSVSAWSDRQLAALFTTVLNLTKQSPSQLDSSTLVALGYAVCGAKAAEMNLFNAVEFSKAVLFLGRLKLSCSEEQLVVLIERLTHSLAFGPISAWGTDVFIEIGVLAAGLPDMAMSALVKEQIEGISSQAISIIPSDKFAVVFDQRQISMFSYEQAAAVTDEQLSALSDVQRTALAMVLTPWEDRPVDFRGKSRGLALSHHPLSLALGLLTQLMIVPRSALICPGP